MARIPRFMISGEPAAYHVISRTALDGYVLGDVEKDYFVRLLKDKARIYFADILGYCVMGNHFHLLVRMRPDTDYADADIVKRYHLVYGKDVRFPAGRLGFYREKWSSLSEFVKEIKVGFSRFYNKRHGRRGFFWGDRFKSVVVENGETLVNCLSYIDLNPVRAGLVQRPEAYRWSSIGYHLQTDNKDGFLSLDFGLRQFVTCSDKERLAHYRRFLYETGAVDKDNGARIDKQVLESERKKDFAVTRTMRFACRTRYFTDSGIIGTKAFVAATFQQFKDRYPAKKDKIPRPVPGLGGIYSLKRLSEA